MIRWIPGRFLSFSRRAVFLPGLLMLLLASASRAEPLDIRQLPADTTWFIHVDLEAANASTIGKAFRAQFLSLPDAQRCIQQARQALGLDPTRDIRSFTVYGAAYAPDAGVLVVRGKIDRSRLLRLLRGLPGYRQETVRDHELYYWQDKRDAASGSTVRPRVGAFHANDAVVISERQEAVIDALNLLDGKGEPLAASSALASAVPPGLVVQAAATGLAEARGLPIQSPILRQCESGALSIGEHGGEAFLHGRIVARSAQTASQIAALIEGARAMAQLQSQDDSDAASVLSAVKVNASSNAVAVDWALPGTRVIQILQSRQQHLARSDAAAPSTEKSR